MKHIKLFESFDQSEVYYHGTQEQFNTFKIGSKIANQTYGGDALDQDLGIFFTDNLIMAKFFAGVSHYDLEDTEEYVDDWSGPGHVISVKLDIKNPWIMNDQISADDLDNSDDDPGQAYFDVIKKEGGGKKFREKLIAEGYDAVVVQDATTNYYADGAYDIIVVFNPDNIKVISKNFK